MVQNNITKPLEYSQDEQPQVVNGLTCICCEQPTLKQFYQPALVAHKSGKFYYDCENENCPMQSSLVWDEYVIQAMKNKS